MYKMMLEQESQGSEDGALVNRDESVLEILEGKGMVNLAQFTENEQTRRGGFHSMGEQTSLGIFYYGIYIVERIVVRHESWRNKKGTN